MRSEDLSYRIIAHSHNMKPNMSDVQRVFNSFLLTTSSC